MKKILFFGNPINTCYKIVKGLRKFTDLDIDLLLSNENSFMDHPAWDEIPIKIPFKTFFNDPINSKLIFNKAISKYDWQSESWIKTTPQKIQFYDIFLNKLNSNHFHKKRIKHYSKSFQNYDLIISDGVGCISAMEINKTYIVLPYGSDFYTIPYSKSILGDLTKKVFFRASKILAPFQTEHEIKNLCNSSCKFFPLSWIVDPEKYPLEKTTKHKTINFFLNSRIDFKEKGTNIILKAFEQISKSFDVNLTILNYGPDIINFSKMVEKLNLKKNITIINDALSFPLILDEYQKSDGIICGLNVANVGVAEVESLLLNKPVISNVGVTGTMEKDLPILRAHSLDEVIAHMISICNNEVDISFGRNSIMKWSEPQRYVSNFINMIK